MYTPTDLKIDFSFPIGPKHAQIRLRDLSIVGKTNPEPLFIL